MEDSKLSRRRLLGAAGTACTVGIAGCSDIFNNNGNNSTEGGPSTPDVEDFNFAEGYSESGVDVETVLAEDGIMASLSGVQATVNRSVDSLGRTQESSQSGRYDVENERFIANIESTQVGQTVTQNYYLNEGTLYIRRQSPDGGEPQLQKDTYEFSTMTDLNLQALKQHISGVNMSLNAIESRSGNPVAVYTAETSDFSSESLFGGSLVEQRSFDRLDSAQAELVVDEQGYIYSVSLTAEMVNAQQQPTNNTTNNTTNESDGSNETTTTIETNFTYSNFNSVSISEPSWVGNNTFEDLSAEPTVDVDFSEEEGESVTATVNSIENADAALFVINNTLITQTSEPGSQTIEATQYTGDDGSVQTITVFASRGQQQPTQITTFTPNEPASTTSSGGNTTNTSE